MTTATAPREPVAAASPGNDTEITLQQALPRLAALAARPHVQGWHIVLAGRVLAEGLNLAAVSPRQFQDWTGKGRSTFFNFKRSAIWAEICAFSPAVQTSGPCMGTSMFLKDSFKHSTTQHDPADRTPGPEPDTGPAVELALKRLDAVSWGLRSGYRVEEPADLIARHGARSVLYACFCAQGKRSPAGFIRWHLETAGKAAPEGWEDPELREAAAQAPQAPAVAFDGLSELGSAPEPMRATAPEWAVLHAEINDTLPEGVQVDAVAVERRAVTVWMAAAAFQEHYHSETVQEVAARFMGEPVSVAFAEAGQAVLDG